MVEIDIFSFSFKVKLNCIQKGSSISKEMKPKLPAEVLKFSKRTKVELVARDLIFKLYLDIVDLDGRRAKVEIVEYCEILNL
jgi:hypothetical protein